MTDWATEARAAEQCGDWDAAVATVAAVAQCYSTDYVRHDAHLWHMDLLAKAGRIDELTALAVDDRHARRRLNRLFHDEGNDTALRHRAHDGDRDALYRLVRLLRTEGRDAEARQVVADVAPDDAYAVGLAHEA